MIEQQQSLQDLRHIKSMMERSSRFISLSGLSGISAGICALVGVWVAHPFVTGEKDFIIKSREEAVPAGSSEFSIVFNNWVFWIAMATFVAALISAFIFTYIKTRKEGLLIWGAAARRMVISISVPIFVGGLFILKLAQLETYSLVAPGCLLFYGLALINASKYTLDEIRYLGYCEILLGFVCLLFVEYGIYCWAVGFGLLHILYGSYMWKKYDNAPGK